MKFYGHADLQKNELQNAALQTTSTFPADPVVGMLAFVNSIVYICVGNGSLPVWVPLTREITAYTHTQSEASDLWDITHGLNTTSVNIQVFDAQNRVLIPDTIETISPTTARVTFGTEITGRAVIVTGHFDGNVKPTYAQTFFQPTAQPEWTILHGLGYNPIVRVFIGNNEVQPASIVHDSATQLTITFNTAQAGYARLI